MFEIVSNITRIKINRIQLLTQNDNDNKCNNKDKKLIKFSDGMVI